MAKKNMNMDKVQFMPTREMRKTAAKHLRAFVNRVTEKGLDKNGNPFKSYSEKYRKLKGGDFRRKRDGKRYKRFVGIPLSNEVGNPDFQLTYKTMRNFKRKANITKDHYVLGWTGESALIVSGNKERGRNIIGVPGSEITMVARWLGITADKEMQKKIKNIKITVG